MSEITICFNVTPHHHNRVIVDWLIEHVSRILSLKREAYISTLLTDKTWSTSSSGNSAVLNFFGQFGDIGQIYHCSLVLANSGGI
jgi:hypothetical protein